LDWRELRPDDEGLPSVSEALEAIQALAMPEDGVILLSGFESRPAIIDTIATMAEQKGAKLYGNDGPTVSAVKDPSVLFPALTYLGIDHPPTRTELPENSKGWLSKQVGGAGGAHLTSLCPFGPNDEVGRRYWQQLLPGNPVSVQVLGNGGDAMVLGFCEQWIDPTLEAPFRFGGVVLLNERPAWADVAGKWALAVSQHFKLRGLASVDFIISESGAPVLIEVNPRPGQSLDVFAGHVPDLLALHVAACAGTLPLLPIPTPTQSIASAIAYAPKDGKVAHNFHWPPGSADIPRPGRTVVMGQPFASVIAQEKSAPLAKEVAQAGIKRALDAIITNGR
jgi:predicted ATP-grasp superfamily ATP-dependent carboligase